MRAHHVVEGIKAIRVLAAAANKPDVFDQELWQTLEEMYSHAVNFDFGDANPTDEQVQFGSELHEKNLFHTPFPVMFISSTALGQGHSVLVSNQSDVDGPEKFICISTAGVALSRADRGKLIPAPVCAMMVSKDTVDWRQLMTLQSAKRSTGEPQEFDGAKYEAHVQFAYGAIAMLMSKDVEQRIEPAPIKLNNARARKGKGPIQESRIIRIRAEAMARYAGARTGTHASPRMHWRRGHFRMISSGRVIPVAPTIVNATDKLKEVAKKDYEVTI